MNFFIMLGKTTLFSFHENQTNFDTSINCQFVGCYVIRFVIKVDTYFNFDLKLRNTSLADISKNLLINKVRAKFTYV